MFVSVRWPFRFLAGLVVLAGLVAIFGFIFMAWSGSDPRMGSKQLIFLPGVVRLIRFAWHAALQGRSPSSQWWPFASERVAMCYFAILLLVLYA